MLPVLCLCGIFTGLAQIISALIHLHWPLSGRTNPEPCASR